MAPIHLIAIFPIQDGKLQTALDASKIQAEEVHKNEPGLLRYFAFTTKNEDGQDQLVFVEKYADAEGLKAHTSTTHYKTFEKAVGEFLAGPPVIKRGDFVVGFENRSSL